MEVYLPLVQKENKVGSSQTSNDIKREVLPGLPWKAKICRQPEKNEIASHRNDNLSSMLNCNTIALYLPVLDICF